MRIGKGVVLLHFVQGIVGLGLLIFRCDGFPLDSYADADQMTLEETTESDEDAWHMALAQNDIQAYEGFLRKNPIGKHAIPAYLKLRNLYADREWEKAGSANTVEALTDYVLRFPDSKINVEAHRLLEAHGENEDPRLKEIRNRALGVVQRNAIKRPILIFSVFATKEPSYFVYKKGIGDYVRVGWHSVNDHLNLTKNLYLNKRDTICHMEYRHGAGLPLLKFAADREGIVLFANQEEFSVNSGREFSDALYALVCDELKVPEDDLNLLWMTGKGRNAAELISSAIQNDTGRLMPKPDFEAGIQSLLKKLDASPRLIARKAGFLIRSIENRGYFKVRIIGEGAERLNTARFNNVRNIVGEAFYDWLRWEPTASDSALCVNISVDWAGPFFGRTYITPEGKIPLYTDGLVYGSVYLSLTGIAESSGNAEKFRSYYGPPRLPGSKVGEKSLIEIPWEEAKNYKYPDSRFYNAAFEEFYSSDLVPMLRRLLEEYFEEDIFIYDASYQGKEP